MKKLIEKYSKKPDGLFKTLFVTFLFGYLPFAILHIVLNFAGIIPVNFNDKAIYGWQGALVIIVFIPLIVVLLTVPTWIFFMVGNLFLRFLRKIFL
ncbi:hypothetical protein [Flavobacterium sp.]|uniref:hypothetical protein n=1 Tax=Flavobacterium sp. TaxID=239 RepID=UPI003B99518F